MDLLAFERKLDQTIMRKRLDIQEALKRPIKVLCILIAVIKDSLAVCCIVLIYLIFFSQQKRKLRIFISNTFNPAKSDVEDGEGTVASWELRVEGRLLEDVSVCRFGHSVVNSCLKGWGGLVSPLRLEGRS